jgi:acyl dehydratase
MALDFVAERLFGDADQAWFVSVTGDCNPMHIDALIARRTMAGRPVVHGIHVLIWALDSLVANVSGLPTLSSLTVSFEKMVYVGDTARVALTRRDDDKARAEVMVGDVAVFVVDLEFGTAIAGTAAIPGGSIYHPTEPANLSFAQMETQKGRIPLPDGTGTVAQRFPAVTAALGVERVACLAKASYLVGMVCPGLHSIFRGLHLTVSQEGPDLRFHVNYANEDYRLIRMAVSGGGWTGIVDAYARPEPAKQATIAAIAAKVASDEFTGASALVVGGSRGLGEVIAKILAAGGAKVTITYAVGEADARCIQTEIAARGGYCDIMRYDVRAAAKDQVAALRQVPTDLYFMATPQIFQRAEPGFSAARLHDFLTFYVTGFSDLCQALKSEAGLGMGIYYPSSVSIDDRPANMTEYTMAKAAGEVLCADMTAFGRWSRIVMTRLPRLPTDQTATLYDDDAADPVDAMLSIVRAVQGAGNTSG